MNAKLEEAVGKVYEWEPRDAVVLRERIALAGYYPTRDMVGDEDNDKYEENIRQQMPLILEHLGRNDLVAIYRMASLLVKIPPNTIFDFIKTYICDYERPMGRPT